MEFTKHTWDGQDYVRYVWADWMADPRGILVVAEYAGRAVGLAKVTELAPGQWWLEGFRVDLRFQGRKIGSHIHTYVDDWWQQQGNGIVRLMTGSQRVQVQHLCEKLGYAKIGEVAGFSAPPLNEPTASFHLLNENEISRAVLAAVSSPALILSNGLIDLGWRFVTPNPVTFRELVDEKMAWWWRDRQGLLLAWEDGGEAPEDDRMLAVGSPLCPLDMLPEFLLDVRRLVAQSGYARAFWIAPIQAELELPLRKAGYERTWEHSGFLYEKRHAAPP